MDEMQSKISEILSDPDSMEKLKRMAEGLFGSSKEPEPEKAEPSQNGLSFEGLPDGFDISKIMGLVSLFSSRGEDPRAGLLLALKPHLSSDRQTRVDKAVKLLKLASLIPLLKEQGLLDNII